MNPEPILYDVHLFAVIRRKLPGISAANPQAAITAAQASPTVGRWLRVLEDPEGIGEFADEFSHFLVDVVGDAELEQSRWFQSETDPLLRPLRELIQWNDAGRDPDVLRQLLANIRQILQDTL